MWQFLGTLAIAAFGGSFLIYYLTNFLLEEKAKFSFDWDGVAERALIAYLVMTPGWLYAIPFVVLAKIAARLLSLRYLPEISAQRVKLKSELALELFLSPLFAVVVGLVF